MFRELEKKGKTVEEALELACLELGVSSDDINVTYEILEMPVRKFFRSIPAKVLVKVEIEDAPVAVEPVKEQPVVETKKVEKAPEPKKEKLQALKEKPQAKPVSVPEKQEQSKDFSEQAIDIDNTPKVKIAVDYLKDVISNMGVDTEKVEITCVAKNGAVIIRMAGKGLGVLIGRRGETMESLSYLASLVANREDGEYLKFGLDVAGYRDKRESDLAVLAKRLCDRVIKNNRAYAMEPMNPYERRLIHSAVGEIEGVISQSAGEGKDRHIVILSTAEGANNDYPETENSRGRSGQSRGRKPAYNNRRSGGARQGGYNNRERAPRKDFAPRKNSLPERDFAPVDTADATPVAPKRTQRVDDMADFGFGKIDI